MKINSLEELQKACANEPTDFYISLAGGAIRSSKSIQWDKEAGKAGKFYILNEIDDTRMTVTPETIATRTNIVEAITKGTFFKY